MFERESRASVGFSFQFCGCLDSWPLEKKETILKAYPYPEAEDIDEALRYAAFLAEEETVRFSR